MSRRNESYTSFFLISTPIFAFLFLIEQAAYGENVLIVSGVAGDVFSGSPMLSQDKRGKMSQQSSKESTSRQLIKLVVHHHKHTVI